MSSGNTTLRFSVVLPVRNGGEYVKECVASVLKQSHAEFELLVLENCSTDGTAEWLQSIDDERVTIVCADRPLSLEENWSRISAIKTSDFLTIIGHDDSLDPNYLEVMSALINKHPKATLYQTHFQYIDGNGRFLRHCLPMCEVQQVHEFVAKQFMRTLDSMGSGFMMRRKDFDTVGGFSRYHNLIFGDYELWVRLAGLGYLAIDPAECFYYREHASASASTQVVEYQGCLFKYMLFLDNEARKHAHLEDVIRRYGANYIEYMCEGLINRGLTIRRTTDRKPASQIANEFHSFSTSLMPDGYMVNRNPRIRIAILVDKWIIGRAAYLSILKVRGLLRSMLNQDDRAERA